MRNKDLHVYLTILVAALGYFVDVFDLITFSAVRVPSLKSFGLSDQQILSIGVDLLNLQLLGLLLGGIVWGIIGDKIGRLKVLYGSILTYSIANLLNAFVTTIPEYGILRFIAGFGLADELGAGITMVSELLPTTKRGYGTCFIAFLGVSGAVAAGVVAKIVDWQTMYIIGGVLGFLLLFLRVSIGEPEAFQSACSITKNRGNLIFLFSDWTRVKKFLCMILICSPVLLCPGIFLTFSYEICTAIGLSITVSTIVIINGIGLTLGDLFSGMLSQFQKSRKRTIALFLLIFLSTSLILLTKENLNVFELYILFGCLSFGIGYWAVFVTVTAEQFGTNIRSTVTTSIPNLARASAIPMTLGFREFQTSYGTINTVLIIECIVMGIATISLFFIQETFGKNLHYVEDYYGETTTDQIEFKSAANT